MADHGMCRDTTHSNNRSARTLPTTVTQSQTGGARAPSGSSPLEAPVASGAPAADKNLFDCVSTKEEVNAAELEAKKRRTRAIAAEMAARKKTQKEEDDASFALRFFEMQEKRASEAKRQRTRAPVDLGAGGVKHGLEQDSESEEEYIAPHEEKDDETAREEGVHTGGWRVEDIDDDVDGMFADDRVYGKDDDDDNEEEEHYEEQDGATLNDSLGVSSGQRMESAFLGNMHPIDLHDLLGSIGPQKGRRISAPPQDHAAAAKLVPKLKSINIDHGDGGLANGDLCTSYHSTMPMPSSKPFRFEEPPKTKAPLCSIGGQPMTGKAPRQSAEERELIMGIRRDNRNRSMIQKRLDPQVRRGLRHTACDRGVKWVAKRIPWTRRGLKALQRGSRYQIGENGLITTEMMLLADSLLVDAAYAAIHQPDSKNTETASPFFWAHALSFEAYARVMTDWVVGDEKGKMALSWEAARNRLHVYKSMETRMIETHEDASVEARKSKTELEEGVLRKGHAHQFGDDDAIIRKLKALDKLLKEAGRGGLHSAILGGHPPLVKLVKDPEAGVSFGSRKSAEGKWATKSPSASSVLSSR